MKATGAARIKGQGVAATSTARPRTGSCESAQAAPATQERHGQKQQRIAIRHPHEGRLGGLRRRHQCDDAGVGAVARRARRPASRTSSPALTVPLSDASPTWRATGRGSPVTADSSSEASELAIRPSTGTTSPARTSSVSPTRSGRSARLRSDSRCADARCAARDRPAISRSRSARPTAKSSSTLPPAYMTATTTPASVSPSARAAAIDKKRDRVDAHSAGPKVANDRDGEARRNGNRARRPDPSREPAASRDSRGKSDRKPRQRDDDEGSAHPPFVDHRRHCHTGSIIWRRTSVSLGSLSATSPVLATAELMREPALGSI